MKSRFLFPHWCRFLGYALLLADVPLFIINQDTFFTTILLSTIAGLLLAGFSRERIEDEQISKLRLVSCKITTESSSFFQGKRFRIEFAK